jgi:hypothetical protein
MEKIIRLQDAKFKTTVNNNNETSIFIDQSIVSFLGLIDGKEFIFKLDKENILKALSFTYSFNGDLFNKHDKLNLDSIWFQREYDLIINHFNETSNFKVEVNRATGDRYYLKSLKQPSGFNLRSILIQDHFKLIFSKGNNNIILDYSDIPFDKINGLEEDENREVKIGGTNTIYFGAPGTGKSFHIENILRSVNHKFYERVTFHPEYDYHSFVGGYKPVSEKDGQGNEIIKYKFIPQVFTNIYKKAWQDLENQHYLVIEEINRGNCAEIFGDLFQLLDRNSNYSISPSKELKEYLESPDGFNDIHHPGIINGLSLPPNLVLLATMNTSDQSLFPMDSAFKRRWEWEYVPISYSEKNENGVPNDSFNFIVELDDEKYFNWIDFIGIVNSNYIKSNPTLGMDKCIGNYFIKPYADNKISLKQFISKVIFYLWNDVFKDEIEDNSIFEKNSSYEDFFPLEKGKIELEKILQKIELKVFSKEYETGFNGISSIAAEDKSEYESPN